MPAPTLDLSLAPRDRAARRALTARSQVLGLTLAAYLVPRALNALMILAAAPRQLPASRMPPGYHATATPSVPATFGDVVTNWDGQWYLDIVLHGYPASAFAADGQPAQTSLAFYPLFPSMVRILMEVTGAPFVVVAPVLNLLCGAAAFVVLQRLFASRVGRTRSLLALGALSCFVSAPVLMAAYTEGLALLLVASTLLLLSRRAYLAAVPVVLLLGLTRNIVAPVLLVVAVHGYAAWRGRDSAHGRHATSWGRWTALLATCSVAVLLWPALVGLHTREPAAYFETLSAWPGFSPSLVVPPLLQAVLSGGPPAWLAAVLVLGLLAASVVGRPAGDWGMELRTWAAVYPAYVLWVSSASLSLLRYLLLAFPLALLLAPAASAAGSRRWRLVAWVVSCGVGVALQWWWISSVLVVHAQGSGALYP